MKSRPDKQIPIHLRQLASKLNGLIASITAGVPRTDESVVLTNLGRRSVIELERVASFYPSPIEGIAWCTRNLFELNLVIRYVLLDTKNVNVWIGQTAGDEMQMIESVLTLAKDTHPTYEDAKKRHSKLAEICNRRGIDPSKPFQIEKLAKEVNRYDDYKAFYKLFSKYVHPSSWLVNSNENAIQHSDMLNFFIIHAQLNSGNTYVQLETWLKSRGPLH